MLSSPEGISSYDYDTFMDNYNAGWEISLIINLI